MFFVTVLQNTGSRMLGNFTTEAITQQERLTSTDLAVDLVLAIKVPGALPPLLLSSSLCGAKLSTVKSLPLPLDAFFLAYFPKAGLCDLLPVCVSPPPPLHQPLNA
jgi:hypothetical protein